MGPILGPGPGYRDCEPNVVAGSGSFGPDEIDVMTVAYEGALTEIPVASRDDPITELIAKAIVNVAATGERDPKAGMERALNALGIRRSAA